MEVPPQSVLDPNPQRVRNKIIEKMFISKLKTKQMKTFWIAGTISKIVPIKPSFLTPTYNPVNSLPTKQLGTLFFLHKNFCITVKL